MTNTTKKPYIIQVTEFRLDDGTHPRLVSSSSFIEFGWENARTAVCELMDVLNAKLPGFKLNYAQGDEDCSGSFRSPQGTIQELVKFSAMPAVELDAYKCAESLDAVQAIEAEDRAFAQREKDEALSD